MDRILDLISRTGLRNPLEAACVDRENPNTNKKYQTNHFLMLLMRSRTATPLGQITEQRSQLSHKIRRPVSGTEKYWDRANFKSP